MVAKKIKKTNKQKRKTMFKCAICGKKAKKPFFNDIDLWDQLLFNYSEKPKCSKCFKQNYAFQKRKTKKVSLGKTPRDSEGMGRKIWFSQIYEIPFKN